MGSQGTEIGAPDLGPSEAEYCWGAQPKAQPRLVGEENGNGPQPTPGPQHLKAAVEPYRERQGRQFECDTPPPIPV